MKTIEVKLTSKEIYFLCELLKVEFIVGLTDPYKGCTENEIQNDWMKVKEGLIEKGLLFEKETYEIERKCAILINAMRPSSVCCWFSLIEDGKQESCHYYFTPQMAIQKTQHGDRDLFQIKLAGTPKEILEEILERFSLTAALAAGGPFSLPRTSFDQLLVGESSEFLYSEDFLKAMKTLKKAGQLELVVWDDPAQTWDHEDFHFIEGDNGVWGTTPEVFDGEEEEVYLQPASAKKVESHIESMIMGRLFRD